MTRQMVMVGKTLRENLGLPPGRRRLENSAAGRGGMKGIMHALA